MAAPTTCSVCGAPAPDGEPVLAGWSTSSSSRGVQWVCTSCTREHVRSIEAKLDEEWW
jgi:hypothetical protein